MADLAIRPPTGLMNLSLAETLELGKVLAASGMFRDMTDGPKAVVKILYGRELGVGPIASLMGIHIIEGKPSPSASLIATLIQNSRRFKYRVATLTPTICELEFYEEGELVGTTTFTMEQARAIVTVEKGLKISLADKATYQNYPEDMLFARALSRGARRYCAAVFGGAPVYAAEEAEEIVDSTVVEVVPFTVPEPDPPLAPAQKHALQALFLARGANLLAQTAWLQAAGFAVARIGQLTAAQAGQAIAQLRAESIDADAGVPIAPSPADEELDNTQKGT